jgi:hypothetical protein
MSEPDEDLFRVMIESIEPERSFFQVFWSSATHIGAAIDTIVSACVRMGIRNPSAREADCVAFDSLPENAVHDKRLNIWYGPGRSYFLTEKAFIAPAGIVESIQKGEDDYELIREGFRLPEIEEGIYEVERLLNATSCSTRLSS